MASTAKYQVDFSENIQPLSGNDLRRLMNTVGRFSKTFGGKVSWTIRHTPSGKTVASGMFRNRKF